ncbi:hypothetical protein ACHAWX_007662 [Stephanocyclus meneghinianus]
MSTQIPITMSLPLLFAVVLILSNITSSHGFVSPKSTVVFSLQRTYPRSSSVWGEVPLQNKVNGDTTHRDFVDTTNGDVNGSSYTSPISGANGNNAFSSIQLQQTEQKSEVATTKPPSFPLVLWRFTRPHTLIGSAIAIPSIFLLASPTYASFFTKKSMTALAYAAFPSLLMNLYITGLNQITDVEIDKINKPELPIAKGDLKKSTAIAVVVTALVISLAMSFIHPVYSTSGLQVALWGSFILGTLYSLPPFRMKRHPLLAAFCIVAVRGTIINAGFYSHALTAAFGAAKEVASNMAGTGVLQCLLHDWKCSFSSLFFGIFGIVIALMKDVPDATGDRIFNIRSFTVRVGQKRVFRTMKNLLTILFATVGVALVQRAVIATSVGVAIRRGLVGLGCLVAGWSTKWEAREVDAEDSSEVYSYYMHLWKLFYLSYLAMPFVK